MVRTCCALLVLLAVLSTAADTQAQPKRPPVPPPDHPAMAQPAPALFRTELHTSKGVIVIEVHRDWAPKGADRFYNLVRHGFYDDARFFRVIRNFVVQFGIPGDPQLAAAYKDAKLPDEPVRQSNTRGMLSFAKAGPDSRTTQLFVNTKDNTSLDNMGFAPFAKVVVGMDIVDQLYAEYGEEPNQQRIQNEGNAYLNKDFPKLDFIKKGVVIAATK